MNTFSFTPISDQVRCDTAGCNMATRIRIDGRPCCSTHMAQRLKEGAIYRLVEAARRERDRRRTERRVSLVCLLCEGLTPHEHKRVRAQRQGGEGRKGEQ
jgi:hypothetical protein